MAKSKPICSVADCCKPQYARGWCEAHYRRWLVQGTPLRSDVVARTRERKLRAGAGLTSKTCAKCRVEKQLDAFPLQSNGKGGRRSRCRACCSDDHAQRRAAQFGSMEAYKASRVAMNPAQQIESRRAATRRFDAKRRATPRGRLENAISAGIAGSLARSSKAGRSWQSLVGYSLHELMAHLERKFQPGMSWDNYGEWHVDHRIPKSAFNYDRPEHLDFARCWALSNLQPMWAKQNISKRDRLTMPFQPSLAI